MKMWGRNTSSNVQKAMWAVGELKLPCERIDVGGAYGKTKEPFYLAMNPNSLVPTLEEDDGFTLWESNSVVRYLSGKHGGALEPKDAEDAREGASVDGLAALRARPRDHAGVLGPDPHPAGEARPDRDRQRQDQDHRRGENHGRAARQDGLHGGRRVLLRRHSGRRDDPPLHGAGAGAAQDGEPRALVRRDFGARPPSRSTAAASRLPEPHDPEWEPFSIESCATKKAVFSD